MSTLKTQEDSIEETKEVKKKFSKKTLSLEIQTDHFEEQGEGGPTGEVTNTEN